MGHPIGDFSEMKERRLGHPRLTQMAPCGLGARKENPVPGRKGGAHAATPHISGWSLWTAFQLEGPKQFLRLCSSVLLPQAWRTVMSS